MVERGGLGVMGICTRIMFLLFYLSCIISLFSDPLSIPVDSRLTYIITGYALLLLGFAIFFLSFIEDFIKYRKDRKR
ncbi:MAG: hypothetical protein ACFFA7_03240 [Promethearchaeota archaeon]